MKNQIVAILKMVRWMNLLIIAATQLLTHYCLIGHFFRAGEIDYPLTDFEFLLIMVSTLFIAAGGYIINDINDRAPDSYNKPGRNIIGKIISTNTAKSIYWFLTILGILIGVYLSYAISYHELAVIYVMIAGLLWYYSFRYKCTVVMGNLLIAGMSAFVILIVWLFDFFALRNNPASFGEILPDLPDIWTFVFAYTIFAFLTSVIRELIKDMEDVEGDQKVGCFTLAVKHGLSTSKYTTLSFSVFTVLFIAIFQIYLYKSDFTELFIYFLIIVQPLFLFFIYRLIRSTEKSNFKYLSRLIKGVMVAGIISMLMFCI